MKSKATTFGNNQDYMFIDLASELIPKNVVALYKKLLNSGSSIEDIQVLTAKNVGDVIARGADTIVAGTEFFKNGEELLRCANGAV